MLLSYRLPLNGPPGPLAGPSSTLPVRDEPDPLMFTAHLRPIGCATPLHLPFSLVSGGRGVSVGLGARVGLGVRVTVGVALGGAGVSVGGTGVFVGVSVGAFVGVEVGALVGTGVSVSSCVAVAAGVDVSVGVGDGVDVGSLVGVGISVAPGVAVGVGVGVDVGADVAVGVGVIVAVGVGVAVPAPSTFTTRFSDCVDLPTESRAITNRVCCPTEPAGQVWSAVIENWPTELPLFVTATWAPSAHNSIVVTPLLSVATVCTVT